MHTNQKYVSFAFQEVEFVFGLLDIFGSLLKFVNHTKILHFEVYNIFDNTTTLIYNLQEIYIHSLMQNNFLKE